MSDTFLKDRYRDNYGSDDDDDIESLTRGLAGWNRSTIPPASSVTILLFLSANPLSDGCLEDAVIMTATATTATTKTGRHPQL